MNSKSDIANELESIKQLNNDFHEESDSQCQMRKLLEKNIKNIEDNINKRIINIYERPWKKLEKKLKLNKVKEYIKENNIEENDVEFINKYFMDKTKATVEYDIEQCKITNIKLKN